MEDIRDKVQLVAMWVEPIVGLVDQFLACEPEGIETLQMAKNKMSANLSRSLALSFIVGGNDFGEAKTEAEAETLQALIQLIEARRQQQIKVVEATARQEQIKKNRAAVLKILNQ